MKMLLSEPIRPLIPLTRKIMQSTVGAVEPLKKIEEEEFTNCLTTMNSQEKNENNETLFGLIEKHRSSDIEARLLCDPKEAATRAPANLHGPKSVCYPLHCLCRMKKAPVSTFTALLRAAPQAASFQEESHHSLPLHIACWNDLPVAIIDVLVEANKEVLAAADADGNLPLHLAASRSGFCAVQYLLDATDNQELPGIVAHANHRQQTPLHCACLRQDMSVEVLEQLVAVCSKDPSVDWQGRSLLHTACMHRAGKDVMQFSPASPAE
jgi:hypothetical protein